MWSKWKKGGWRYYPPKNGWKGFGLKVLNKYDGGNNDWLAHNGNSNEWAIAYHGIGVKLGYSLEGATESILSNGFKVGIGQAYSNDLDENHYGQKVGRGVYCSPYPEAMEKYAKAACTSTTINGKKFIMGFMMRVKPNKIRYSKRKKEYWVLNGTIDEMRPYRIMIKEYKNDSGCALF